MILIFLPLTLNLRCFVTGFSLGLKIYISALLVFKDILLLQG